MPDEKRVSRLQRVFDLPAIVKTPNELKNWLSSRWDHFVNKGPLAHKPNRRSYVELPWAGKPQNLYAGLYPGSTATNLLDFKVFVFYTSSIQQDLFATGKAELAFFFPDEKQIGINRIQTRLGFCELLLNHNSIMARLRELKILSNIDWLMQLEYKSAIVSEGESDFEIVAHTSEGFLTIFAVAG